MKRIVVATVLGILLVFACRRYLFNRLTPAVIRAAAKRAQGLNVSMKSLEYDGWRTAVVKDFRILDEAGQRTVVHVDDVDVVVNPWLVSRGLRAAVVTRARGGTIDMAELKKLLHALCNRPRQKTTPISWIYSAEGRPFDGLRRQMFFSELSVINGEARRLFVTAPYKITELEGAIDVRGLTAHLEYVKGQVKVEVARVGGLPLPFGLDKTVSIKNKKVDMTRLSDKKAHRSLPPEVCESLSFVALLLGGRPVIATPAPPSPKTPAPEASTESSKGHE